MSSTNRGYDRHASDYYRTPISAIEEFLGKWDELADKGLVKDIFTQEAICLDPSAGGDKDFPLIPYPSALKSRYQIVQIDTMDIREDSSADKKADYLTTNCKGYDVIITNPPFYLAQEFIEKALEDVKDDGYVVMLLRLNFFGSKKRFDLWQRHMPIYTFVHHKRLSFTGGKTDSVEYMHAVWKKDVKPLSTNLVVI